MVCYNEGSLHLQREQSWLSKRRQIPDTVGKSAAIHFVKVDQKELGVFILKTKNINMLVEQCIKDKLYIGF